MKMARIVLALLLLLPALSSAAVQPFFAPAKSTGSIAIRLYPMENVSPGNPVLVTFGVPFPRGSITSADLVTVRVLRGGSEIPAYVQQLTPWRHTSNPVIDGKSVRVARVQTQYTFTVRYPAYETITVEWGIKNRTRNVATLQNPRIAWHAVTSGTFVSGDGVYEPDVYATLPREVLSAGLLKPTRMDPFADSIPEKRENPTALNKHWNWPGYLEQQHAAKNNFYTIINEDDPKVTAENQFDYKNARSDTDGEPWLYDRSSSMFILYFRSGFLKPLREAVRAAQYYKNHLNAGGFFTLKGGDDPKYSYNESLAYDYWLTGDNDALQKITLIVKAFHDVPTRWSPNLNFWTERHAGFKLLANVVAYEVTGMAAYKNAVKTESGDFLWLQNGAGGLLPANRVDGGLYHKGSQHDYDWDENAYGGSSWMTALVVDAMVRAYAFTEDQSIAQFIRRVGTFEKAATRMTRDHPYEYGPFEYQELASPAYALLADGSIGSSDLFDVEHALDVGSTLAWAAYFAALQGTPDATLKQQAQSLYKTYDIGVNYWIRPTAPASAGLAAFRVSPPRKYGWEHRVSGSLSWLLNQL